MRRTISLLMTLSIVLLAALLPASYPTQAAPSAEIFYVEAEPSGTVDCRSWQDACVRQAALMKASAGDEIAEDESTSTIFLPVVIKPSLTYLPFVKYVPSFSCDLVTEIPRIECQALQAVFESTAGPNWHSHYGWLETYEPCSWSGVDCFNGYVTRLWWGSCSRFGCSCFPNNLAGALPPELGNLVRLETLELCDNALTNPIPHELGNLTSLRVLELPGNQLTGSIPRQLGQLANLREMELSGNQLSGDIPKELGSLGNLATLDLSGNQLEKSIPEELGKLSELRRLLLSNNRLRDQAPLELGNLGQLWQLTLGGNEPSLCLPSELTDFVRGLSEYEPPPGGICGQ